MASFCYRCMQNTVTAGRCTSCGSSEVRRGSNDVNLLPLGTKLDGGNVIVGDKLGAGGFGVTYIARDQKYGVIALKEFMPRYMIIGKRKGIALEIDEEKRAIYEKCLAGFRREARVLNDLRHPNIVQVLFEMEEQGTAYYGMELLQGCNLAQWLHSHGVLTPQQACQLLLPVMDALIHVHSRGVLHRDISPDNIFLRTAPGQYMDVSPCLIDFGAAYIAMDDYTHTCPNVKKKGYSPPDQNVDRRFQSPRIDVYAFSATVYYMLTGVVPPPASDRMDGYQDLIPPEQLKPGISAEISALLMNGMELNSQKRIPSIAEFKKRFCQATGIWDRLEQKHEAETPTPPPPPPPPLPPSPAPFSMPSPAPVWAVPQWKYLVSLLIEAAICIAPPTVLLATTAPLIGILLGIVLMYAVNLLLSRTPSGLTLGQQILGMNGLAPLTNAFVYNLIRCFLPLSLLDELAALLGLTTESFMERTFRPPMDQSIPSDIAAPPRPDTPSPKPDIASAHLICCAQNRQGERLNLGQKQVLGRNAAQCDIIPSHTDRALSGRHCIIYYSDASGHGWHWYIQDYHSTNGTYVNGVQVSEAKGAVQIRHGDKITIGSEDYIFKTN